jgi:hypothetical protein
MREGDTDCCHLAVWVHTLEEAVSALKLISVELEEPKVVLDFMAVFLKTSDPDSNHVYYGDCDGQERR